jgi:hypothetical protein
MTQMLRILPDQNPEGTLGSRVCRANYGSRGMSSGSGRRSSLRSKRRGIFVESDWLVVALL